MIVSTISAELGVGGGDRGIFPRKVTNFFFIVVTMMMYLFLSHRTRWAAQSEGDHDRHIRHVGYRAVLELFFSEFPAFA